MCGGQKITPGIILQTLPTLYFSESLAGLELTKKTSLAGQGAPGNLSPPP